MSDTLQQPEWWRTSNSQRNPPEQQLTYQVPIVTSQTQAQVAKTEVLRDVYETYRKQIEHEDQLIGMRNGWLIGGQAFLFAAYAALLAIQRHGVTRPAHQLFTELPWVGIALAALVLSAVVAALWRSHMLCKQYKKHWKRPRKYPKIISTTGPRLIGHSVALLVPSVLVIAWIWVLVAR